MPKYLFAQNVTTEELDAIKNFKQLGPRQFQRGRLVELSTTGWRCQQIATAVGLCVSRVRAWIHRFNQQRLPGLMAKKSPGRSRKFPKEIRDRIRALVGDCEIQSPGNCVGQGPMAHVKEDETLRPAMESLCETNRSSPNLTPLFSDSSSLAESVRSGHWNDSPLWA